MQLKHNLSVKLLNILFRDGANEPEAAISMPTHRLTDLFTEEKSGWGIASVKDKDFHEEEVNRRGVYEFRLIGWKSAKAQQRKCDTKVWHYC